MLNRCLIAVLAALAAAFAAPAFGEDGKVVLALGAGAGSSAMQYTLKLRSADGRFSRNVTYVQDHPLSNKRDFDGAEENGVVRVLSLPAGAWEIFGAAMTNWPTEYRPLASFQIPFTVLAGQAIYIGDYRARAASGADKALGLSFEVSDQSARDIPVAKRADKKISEIAIALPDVTGAHTPVFVSPADLIRALGEAKGAMAPLCTGDGCASASGDLEIFRIETIPSGAEVKTSAGLGCLATPCSISAPRDAPFDVTVSLSGYQAAPVRIGVSDFGGSGARQHVSVFGTLGTIADVAAGKTRELSPNPLLILMAPAAPSRPPS